VLRSILLDDSTITQEQNPELSVAVCDVLERALAKDPEKRYQSGESSPRRSLGLLNQPIRDEKARDRRGYAPSEPPMTSGPVPSVQDFG